MDIPVICPKCGKQFQSPESDEGRTVPCPGCTAPVAVPFSASPPNKAVGTETGKPAAAADAPLLVTPSQIGPAPVPAPLPATERPAQPLPWWKRFWGDLQRSRQVAKLRRQIHELEVVLRPKFVALGASVAPSPPAGLDVAAPVAEIQRLDGELAVRQSRLAALGETPATATVRQELRREIQAIRVRCDDALESIGRKAYPAAAGDPTVRREIDELLPMLDDRRRQFEALVPGGPGAGGFALPSLPPAFRLDVRLWLAIGLVAVGLLVVIALLYWLFFSGSKLSPYRYAVTPDARSALLARLDALPKNETGELLIEASRFHAEGLKSWLGDVKLTPKTAVRIDEPDGEILVLAPEKKPEESDLKESFTSREYEGRKIWVKSSGAARALFVDRSGNVCLAGDTRIDALVKRMQRKEKSDTFGKFDELAAAAPSKAQFVLVRAKPDSVHQGFDFGFLFSRDLDHPDGSQVQKLLLGPESSATVQGSCLALSCPAADVLVEERLGFRDKEAAADFLKNWTDWKRKAIDKAKDLDDSDLRSLVTAVLDGAEARQSGASITRKCTLAAKLVTTYAKPKKNAKPGRGKDAGKQPVAKELEEPAPKAAPRIPGVRPGE